VHRRPPADQGVELAALTTDEGATRPGDALASGQSELAPANTCWNSWLVMPPWLGNWITAALLAVDPPATSMASPEFLLV
jgi:hypothetical protein